MISKHFSRRNVIPVIDFTILIYLKKENLTFFSETLSSVLNQTGGFADLFIISDIPETDFDIRTVNTKIIKDDFHAMDIYSRIFPRSFSDHLILLNNIDRKIILDHNFCVKLQQKSAALLRYPLISVGNENNQGDMLIINKNLIDQKIIVKDWFIHSKKTHLPVISPT